MKRWIVLSVLGLLSIIAVCQVLDTIIDYRLYQMCQQVDV